MRNLADEIIALIDEVIKERAPMYISSENCLAPDLMAVGADVVPNDITFSYDLKQGDKVGSPYSHEGQTLLQFYSGSNDYFVCLMDFEDWGGERCPRFAYYKQVGQTQKELTFKLIAVKSTFDWSPCR